MTAAWNILTLVILKSDFCESGIGGTCDDVVLCSFDGDGTYCRDKCHLAGGAILAVVTACLWVLMIPLTLLR